MRQGKDHQPPAGEGNGQKSLTIFKKQLTLSQSEKSDIVDHARQKTLAREKKRNKRGIDMTSPAKRTVNGKSKQFIDGSSTRKVIVAAREKGRVKKKKKKRASQQNCGKARIHRDQWGEGKRTRSFGTVEKRKITRACSDGRRKGRRPQQKPEENLVIGKIGKLDIENREKRPP